METEETPTQESQAQKTKKSRHRKKQLYNAVRDQLEFYFSDSNLSKDRFLGDLVNSSNGEVPIELFLTFNKIKKLTTNEKDIANAISNSELLELTEDKLKVKRKIPLNPKSTEEVENCTLYFENIPQIAKVDHDWVISLFQKYGKVNYVSLPKYKKSEKIKGFGFVEFDNAESVEKAIQMYREFDGVLSYTVLEAEKLMSIATFQKEKEKENEEAGKSEVLEPPIEKEEKSDEPPTKRMRTSSKSEEEKKETEETPKESSEPENPPQSQEVQEPKEGEETEGTTEDATTENEGEKEDPSTPPKKKRRKHKKKFNQKTFQGFQDEKIYEIKIMKKKDWRKMRNAYLDLERKKAKEIKKILMENRKNQMKTQKSEKKPTTSPGNINFYGSPKDVEAGNPAGEKKKELVFEPGLIVKIKFREPIVDIKELKAELKQYNYVKYTDVTEGDFQCFVRVESAASAQELVNQYSSCEYVTEILKDEVEKEYWNKINSQRAQKTAGKDQKKVGKPKKRRGREKLLNKITKTAEHIRFDQEEELVE